ncbi:MAG: penicillin-binding protein 2, partial [Planctomycetota bacterium]
ALLLLLLGRCAYLQLLRGDGLSQQQSQSTTCQKRELGWRGRILTRDRLVLAQDQVSWRVGLDPKALAGCRRGKEKQAAYLRQVVQELFRETPLIPHRDPQQLAERVVESWRQGYQYLFLGDLLSFKAYDAFQLRRRQWEKRGPCFTLEMQPRRVYPQGSFAAQVVGSVRRDQKGWWGIEFSCDGLLKGQDGVRCRERDARGRLFECEPSRSRSAVPGCDVVLTIDSRIQGLLEKLLREARKKCQAESAIGVVMDPQDGAILAMASAPFLAREDYLRFLESGELGRRRLQVAQSLIEPGSTIKPLVLRRALLAGLDPSTQVADGARRQWIHSGAQKRLIRDSSPHGPLDMEGAVIYSSNIGMAQIGLMLGGEQLQSCLRESGLAQKSGIHLPEWPGHGPRSWNWWSIPSVAFGYELMVTPLQIARAYCSIANGGHHVKPHVVHRVGVRLAQPERRAPSSERFQWASRRVRQVLRRAVLEGTGRELNAAALGLAGKTGTTRRIGWNPESGQREYRDGLYASSFIGFAPWQNPRYLALVIIDKPVGSYYGAAVAAPVVRDLIAALLGEPGNLLEEQLEALLAPEPPVPMIRPRSEGAKWEWATAEGR